jgi:hypothetical protein
LTTERLVKWITFLAVFAMAARISVDTDTWWHLRAGAWILENMAVPQVDLFSYTRYGELWQYPGWIVEVPMYVIYRTLGPGGLNLWTAAMVTITFWFVWQTLSGGPFLRAFVIVLAAAASGVYWAARPYLVTFLLAAVFLWILEDYRWRRIRLRSWRVWLLPILMILWANSHGGFAIGFLIWGVYFILELGVVGWQGFKGRRESGSQSSLVNYWRVIRLGLVGLLMVLAVMINPSGPVMLLYPIKTIGIGSLQDYIQEWQSPNFHFLSVQPFAWLILLTFAAVGASRRRIAFTDFALSAGFVFMGLIAGRNIALFALVAPMVITRHLSPIASVIGRQFGLKAISTQPTKGFRSFLNIAILILLASAVVFKISLIYPKSANEEVFRELLPVEAVAFIKEEKPPGRLFNSYNWGGYLLWALPEYPVFIDGRTDLFSDEVIEEWIQVMRVEEGWSGVLESYSVYLVFVETDSTLDKTLLSHVDWDLRYKDDIAVIYQKKQEHH